MAEVTISVRNYPENLSKIATSNDNFPIMAYRIAMKFCKKMKKIKLNDIF